MIDYTSITPFELPCLSLHKRKHLPTISAVYFLIYQKNSISYIGKSLNIYQRWRSHHLLGQLKDKGNYNVAWYECSDIKLLTSLETGLIKLFQPSLNEKLGRKPEDRTKMLLRVNSNTPKIMKTMAESFGYFYNGEGSTGQLLDAIANGDILLVSTKSNK